MNRRAYLVIWFLAVLGIIARGSEAAAQSAPLAVEVKFFLDPAKVLDANHQPNQALRTVFAVSDQSVRMRMQFLDGPGQELHKAEWNIRFRKIDEDKDVKLTFKRRYPVPDALDATLARAAQDGFAKDPDYERELERGLTAETLTFSNSKKGDETGKGNLTLPSADAARAQAVAKMPGKLKRENSEGWAKQVLSTAVVYGPVNGQRWTGHHKDVDKEIDIEVWTLPPATGSGTERIVEISFKKKDYDEGAKAKRKQLRDMLQDKGWLLKEDVLKTKLILDRFTR